MGLAYIQPVYHHAWLVTPRTNPTGTQYQHQLPCISASRRYAKATKVFMVHGAVPTASAATAVEATAKMVTDAAATTAAASSDMAAKATKTLGQADFSGLWKELGQLAAGVTSALDKGYAQTMEGVTAVVKVLVEIILSIVASIVNGATSLYKSLNLSHGLEEILHVPRVIVSGISKELTASLQQWSLNPEKLCEKIFLIVMTLLAIAILKKAYDSREGAKKGSDPASASDLIARNNNGMPQADRRTAAPAAFNVGGGAGAGAAVFATPPSKPSAPAAPIKSPAPYSSTKPKPYFPVQEPPKKTANAKQPAPSSSPKPGTGSSSAVVETKKKKKEKKPNEWVNGTIVFLQALRDYIGEVKPKTMLQEDKVYYTVPAASAQTGPLQAPPPVSKARPATPYNPNTGLEFLYTNSDDSKVSGNGVYSSQPIPADLQLQVAKAVKKEEPKVVEPTVAAVKASPVQTKVAEIIKGNVQVVEPEPIKVAPESINIVDPVKVEAKVMEPVIIAEPTKVDVKVAEPANVVETPTVILSEVTSAANVAAPATKPVESPKAPVAAPPSAPVSSSSFQSTIYPSASRSPQKKAGRIIRVVPPQI